MKQFPAVLVILALCAALVVPALATEVPYTDADSIQHQEAVAALTKLGITKGYTDGTFRPSETLSRAEAASYFAHTMNGGKDFVDYPLSEPSFSDTQGHWAEPYIEYCVSLGILSGRGDGTFDPQGSVTSLELVKMAEATLGYDAEHFGLTGPDWAVQTDKQARIIGLYADLDSVTSVLPATRDTHAQILYNALMATPLRVFPIPQEDGTVTWEFRAAVKEDGTPSSLLWERFGLESLDEIP